MQLGDPRGVFYDIADTEAEAASLTARAQLMIAIDERIKERGWTRQQAAVALNLSPQRMDDLAAGKLSQFDLESLVGVLPSIGLTLTVRAVEA